MKITSYCLKLFIILLLPGWIFAQDISLYQQFNGRYDFTFVGNTLNPIENSFMATPMLLTESSATLTLASSDVIEKAFLYWAGSGTGDFEVLLNQQTVVAERTFPFQRTDEGITHHYFSAFADVTSLVQPAGNGLYTFSGLDLGDFIAETFENRTNFAGWALVIIYQNNSLPLNQLNVYDGLQGVPFNVTITLDSLNVIDDEDAKIGFLAWEGDANIREGESLVINDSIMESLPLNPSNNAFNSTNSFTGANNLYNMDLDFYNIEDQIEAGDSVAIIQLSSTRDFVMINAIVTKLNSQLPDATITADAIESVCRSNQIVVDYTVYNINSTAELQANVPVRAYANGILIGTATTGAPIPIGESQNLQMSIDLPDAIPYDFMLRLEVDDNGSGGIVNETNENNNITIVAVTRIQPPEVNAVPPLTACNQGLGRAEFDFSDYGDAIVTDPSHLYAYYLSATDAENEQNEIVNTTAFVTDNSPQTVYVRVDSADCFAITSFDLVARNCAPTVYNFVSANNDGSNDTFFIEGLRDIFTTFDLQVYNRWGALVWRGNNSIPDWDGYATEGAVVSGQPVPDGTYYYVLKLNDPDYPQPLTGFVYIVN